MAKMRELDGGIREFSEPMSMPPMSTTPPVAPPSMSVNLNAQGMDNIESLLKLMTKVNPDMINQPEKPMAAPMDPMSMLTPPGPSISSIGDLGNLNAGPLKMLPDLDKDEPHSEPDADDMGGPSDNDADNAGPDMDSDYDKDGKLSPHEKDHASEKPLLKSLDKDNDGDHDMDDHDAEKKKDKEESTSFQNATTRPSEKEFGIDAVTHNGTDMNREKGTYPKVAGGDNPMQKQKNESGDLRAQIRAELLQRLAEAKGAK